MPGRTRFFDSHAHLSREFFGEEVEATIARAREAGVSGIVTVGSGSDPGVMAEAVEVARRHEDMVWAAVGVHPHDADRADATTFGALERWLGEGRVVAVGEAGLDYHYRLSSREGQLKVFRRQVEIAREVGKPLVVHCREADADVLAVLAEARLGERAGVIHCFTGDLETARRYVALGFSVSVPGVVTFRNAGGLVEAARGVPVERLLVETDSPFLAPVPVRGRRNEPAFVRHTVEAVARIRGLSVEDIARITEVNARRLFGIDGGEVGKPRLTYAIRDSLYVNLTNRCTLHCTFCGKFRDFVVKGHNLRIGRDPDVEDLWAALSAENFRGFREVVFCGYGEPLLRLDVVKELARRLRAGGARYIRVNTDGLASLVHGRDVVGELAGLVDEVSVSLNAPDAATYARYCRSRYGEAAFGAVCDFLRRAAEVIPEVTATVVALPDLDIEACRRLAENLGVRFRVRPLDDVG